LIFGMIVGERGIMRGFIRRRLGEHKVRSSRFFFPWRRGAYHVVNAGLREQHVAGDEAGAERRLIKPGAHRVDRILGLKRVVQGVEDGVVIGLGRGFAPLTAGGDFL
jgi:hypothetical protein